MEKKFWTDSWDEGGFKTSFHKLDVHRYILKHLTPGRLKNKRVLVPLCGKSVDLMYFKKYAAQVIGIEFIEEAVKQFFQEQQLPYSKAGNTYYSENLTLINTDFFTVTKEQVGHIDLIYDRACLVALPLNLRHKYLKKVDELLPMGSKQFVNTLQYAPTRPEPPFSIPPEEVKKYYGHSHTIEHLEWDTIPNHGLQRVWGLDYVKEHGFLLTKNKLPN